MSCLRQISRLLMICQQSFVRQISRLLIIFYIFVFSHFARNCGQMVGCFIFFDSQRVFFGVFAFIYWPWRAFFLFFLFVVLGDICGISAPISLI